MKLRQEDRHKHTVWYAFLTDWQLNLVGYANQLKISRNVLAYDTLENIEYWPRELINTM